MLRACRCTIFEELQSIMTSENSSTSQFSKKDNSCLDFHGYAFSLFGDGSIKGLLTNTLNATNDSFLHFFYIYL